MQTWVVVVNGQRFVGCFKILTGLIDVGSRPSIAALWRWVGASRA